MERYTSLLHHRLLLPSDTLSAAGVAYHVSDLLVGELRGAVGDKGGPVPGAALEALLLPFVEALRVGEEVALHRIRSVLRVGEGLCVGGGRILQGDGATRLVRIVDGRGYVGQGANQ